jgi:hypothetical protein
MRRLALMTVLCVATPALADRNDFTLERILGSPATPGAVVTPSTAQQSQFRSLMSEMGVVMSPDLLTPADSLGWSGFHFSLDTRFTSISNNADYWKQGVQDVSSGFLSTINLMARKGLWAPLPSFEIGVGGSYLVDSSIFALQAYAKFGIHEGFHNYPVPSISLRGAVSHLLGTNQVDLTVVSTDLTVSKQFGLGGVVKLDPYLGANLLINIARSAVIDTTPGVDAYKQGMQQMTGMPLDLNSNTIFPDQDSILRWRLFLGARLVYHVLSVAAEFAWTFCNDTATNCTVDNGTKITDRSAGQAQISLSAGVVF